MSQPSTTPLSSTQDHSSQSNNEASDITDVSGITINQGESEDHVHRLEALLVGAIYWPSEEVDRILACRDGHKLRILDVGCGDGVWAMGMAKKFPHVEVVGIDKNKLEPCNVPPNCRFDALDVLNEDIVTLEGTFDIVHCSRPMAWAHLYKPLLRKLVSALKSGGLYLHDDGELSLLNADKQAIKPAEIGDEPGTSSWYTRLMQEYRTRAGLRTDMPAVGMVDAVRKLLEEDDRLEGVRSQSFDVPAGSKVSDTIRPEIQKEVSRLAKAIFLEKASLLEAALIDLGMPAEDAAYCLRESG